jgi:hypothetical protein
MSMSFGQRSTPALQLVVDLAVRYGLTIYDPQGDEVTCGRLAIQTPALPN